MRYTMTEKQFRALLDWYMCSDPWPVSQRRKAGEPDVTDEDNHDTITFFIDATSRLFGYENWVVAYHEFRPGLLSPSPACETAGEEGES